MTADRDDPSADARRLRRALSDLMALIAIPSAWTTREPEQIIGTTLDMILGTLRLEFACARLNPSITGSTLEMARLPLDEAGTGHPADVCEAMRQWFSHRDSDAPRLIPNPVGKGEVMIARVGLGLRDDAGAMIAASPRPDFPDDLERLLLRVTANQATMGLQESRRANERRRIGLLNAREAELRTRFDAMLEERTRIAREMHDTLLQGFTGVTLHLAALSRDPSLPDGARAAVQELTTLAQRTVTEGRQAVVGLRMSPLAGRDLADELRRLAGERLRTTGTQLTFDVVGTRRSLAEGAELTALRVMQEALANVATHAGSCRVGVRVAFEAKDFCLTIVDDGVGFSVDPDSHAFGGHWGLVGMRERASEAGGSLLVRSAPGAGTEVTLRLGYGDA